MMFIIEKIENGYILRIPVFAFGMKIYDKKYICRSKEEVLEYFTKELYQ